MRNFGMLAPGTVESAAPKPDVCRRSAHHDRLGGRLSLLVGFHSWSLAGF